MLDIERMYDLIDEGKLVVWELRRDAEILGTLTPNGWFDTPWIGCDFIASPDFDNYRSLFKAFNDKRVPTVEQYQEIQKQVVALRLTLFPANENALPGTVEALAIMDELKAQLIVDFEEPNKVEG
jgi:hypothetical protein